MMNRVEKSMFFCLANYRMFDSFENLENLFEIKFSSLIITKLLKHQKQRLISTMNKKKKSRQMIFKKKTVDCNAKNSINLIIEHFEKFSIFFWFNWSSNVWLIRRFEKSKNLFETDSFIFAKKEISQNLRKLMFEVFQYHYQFVRIKGQRIYHHWKFF